MSTVSTDLARRLQAAGLKWEPKRGDWVQWAGSPGMVIRAGGLFACRIWFFGGVDARWGHTAWLDFDVPSPDLLWLPTGDDCLEVIRSRGLFPAVAAYPGGQGWPAYWGAWVNNIADECVVRLREGDNPAEATGLALAAVLEGEKA